jgi:cell wall-associated NlpC family hydrolase
MNDQQTTRLDKRSRLVSKWSRTDAPGFRQPCPRSVAIKALTHFNAKIQSVMNRTLALCAVFLFVAPIVRANDISANYVDYRSKILTGRAVESRSHAGRHLSKRSSSRAAIDNGRAQIALPKSPSDATENIHSTPALVRDLGSPIDSSVATIKPEALREFAAQPPKVQQLIRDSLSLTERNLNYKYGSSDPSAGGMDCSGFVYHVLKNAGYNDVPRQSSDQYAWLRQKNEFYAVLSRSAGSFEFRDLKPGDLLFWSGTYQIDREIPITHVMIYLGTEKLTNKPVMVGASDGRTYAGVSRSGVSVFDFKMPSGESNNGTPSLIAKFVGYGKIPGLRDLQLETQTGLHAPATKRPAFLFRPN